MGNVCDNFILIDNAQDSFIVYQDNKNDFQIWQGLVGAHYTPYVDANGNLSWTNNGDLPNPPTVNIKGAPGTGLEIKGIVETVGDLPQTANYGDVYLVGSEAPYDGYVYVNGTWTYLGVVGVGQDGRGIASITKTSTVGLVDTYTITYTDGSTPTTFTVTNGADGSPGVGVPTGGTSGQVLKKASSTDYDTEWGVVEALPTGGTTGQVLAKKTNSNYDTEWVNQSGGGADPATATPLMDGTAAVGTATKYAREDHVHPSDTSKQDTLVSGTNIKTVGGQSLLGSGNVDAGGALYFTSVACSATTGNFVSISDAAITADHVLAECVYANPSAITTDVTWTTASGSLTLNGTCASATTCAIVLVKKNN